VSNVFYKVSFVKSDLLRQSKRSNMFYKVYFVRSTLLFPNKLLGWTISNFRLAKLVFIREASASFVLTHNTSYLVKKRSVKVLEGDATAIGR